PEAASGGTLLLAVRTEDDAESLPQHLLTQLRSMDRVLAEGAVRGLDATVVPARRRWAGVASEVGAVVGALRAGERIGLLLHGDVATSPLAREVVAAAVGMGLVVDTGNLPSDLAALLLA